MARKYEISISFTVGTSIEFDGTFDHSAPDGCEEFHDNSYWRSEDVECDGGDITLVVFADDEDDAERIAREVVEDGDEVEDNNGFTWVVSGTSYEITEVEDEIESLGQAREVLDAVIGEVDEDEHPLAVKAVDFVFGVVSTQRQQIEAKDNVITELRSLISDLKAEVAALAEKVAALESTQS